jgi:hypothetical protein
MEELIDFLAQWPYRKAPDDLVLLGLPLFWWNRIGGIMQFIGASFIIAEIVRVFRRNVGFGKNYPHALKCLQAPSKAYPSARRSAGHNAVAREDTGN